MRKIAGVYETEEQAREAVETFRRNNKHDMADSIEDAIIVFKQAEKNKAE